MMGMYVCDICRQCRKAKPHINPLNGRYICGYCLRKISKCPNCDSFEFPENIYKSKYHVGQGEEGYECNNCMGTIPKIRTYSFTPPMSFFFNEDEDLKTTDFFGTEIEVGFTDDAKINRISGIFDKNVYCWPAYDTSIGHGFELKILPMSLKFLRETLDTSLSELWELNNHPQIKMSRANLGMHVHMSTQRMSYIAQCNLATFFGDLKFCKVFGARNASEVNRWFTGLIALFRTYPTPTPQQFRGVMMSGEHHTNISYSRKRTYEVRIFCSTLDKNLYLSRIEALQNIKDFCRSFVCEPDEVLSHSDLLSEYKKWMSANQRQEDMVCAL